MSSAERLGEARGWLWGRPAAPRGS